MSSIPSAEAAAGSALAEPPSPALTAEQQPAEAAEDGAISTRLQRERRPAEHRHDGSHKGHRLHFGTCVAVMTPVGEEETHQNLGAELFVEWNAVPGWLSLELSAGGAALQQGAQLVINLLFKKTFHINARLDPYIGLGPIFLPTIADELISFEYGVGGAAVVGTHIWITSGTGLVAELKYNLLHQVRGEDAGLVQELGAGVGFVFAL